MTKDIDENAAARAEEALQQATRPQSGGSFIWNAAAMTWDPNPEDLARRTAAEKVADTPAEQTIEAAVEVAPKDSKGVK